jgi:Fe-S oxidoreductase
MVAGKDKQANDLIRYNKMLIQQTRAKLLVTSCPICYRVFKEEYNLPIRIQHHSQYLLDLVKHGKIPLQGVHKKVVYHDPCDLGRGSGVYDQPRALLGKIADVMTVKEEEKNARCCGGSLAIFEASQEQRDTMTKEALKILLEPQPDILVTGCPLCKKTFGKYSEVAVKDIAELVNQAIPVHSSGSVSVLSHQE